VRLRVKAQDEILVNCSKKLPKKFSSIFRIDRHAACAASVEDENTIQKSISPFQKGG